MAPSRPLEVASVDRGARPGLPAPAYDTSEGVLVTFGFRCNLACTFCMVEDVLDKYEGASVAEMRARLADPVFMRGATRVVLSGGEATLEKNLLDYVKAAREQPQVRHVRVQTNGTRLVNRDYLRSLIDAGVDEFFVSLHGHDVETCDALTQKKGSFRAIMAGIQAVAESGAALYTNTVIWRRSYEHLGDIVRLVAPYRPRGMEFWNLWPRVDPHDHRDHLVPVATSAPHVRAALDTALDLGIPPKVKFYPRCMLGPHGHLLDDSQPNVLVEPTYWEAAPRYACIHQHDCANSPNDCSGLSFTYIRKFGWEEDVLQPVPLSEEARAERERAGPRTAAEASMSALDAGTPVGPDLPEFELFCAAFALEPGFSIGGFTLGTPTVGKQGLSLPMRRGEEQVLIHLAARDPARRVFARTRSIDLTHGPVPESLSRDVTSLVRALHAHLDGHDQGANQFPGFRARVEVEPVSTVTSPDAFLLATTGTARPGDATFLQLHDVLREVLSGGTNARKFGLDLETSARLSSSGALLRRYLVQVPLDALGANPPATLRDLLGRLDAPASVLDGLEGITRGTRPADPARLHLMMGTEWSDDPARCTRRLYVEQARDRAESGWGMHDTGASDRPFALAWEWTPLVAAPSRLRRYFDAPATTAPLELLRTRFDAATADRFAPLLDDLLQECRVAHAFQRTDVDEQGSRSEAVQYIVEATPVERVQARIEALARAVGTPDVAIAAWKVHVAGSLFRVVGLGRRRDGEWHVTPYLRAAGSMTVG